MKERMFLIFRRDVVSFSLGSSGASQGPQGLCLDSSCTDKVRPILGCGMSMDQETFYYSIAEQVEISVSYVKNKSLERMI